MSKWDCLDCTTTNTDRQTCFICGSACPLPPSNQREKVVEEVSNSIQQIKNDEEFAQKVASSEMMQDNLQKAAVLPPKLSKAVSLHSEQVYSKAAALESWNNIVQFCSSTKELFVDPEFPPTDTSLYGIGGVAPVDTKYSKIVWLRPSQLISPDATRISFRNSTAGLFSPFTLPFNFRNIRKSLTSKRVQWKVFRGTPSPDDICQGNLGNCWLLSAISVLAQKPELLRCLIVSGEKGCLKTSVGVHQVRLFVEGSWKIMMIDDLLPATENGHLVYSKAQRDQLWVTLLEKAAAKVHGSYQSLVRGTSSEGMRLLTGAPCETLNIRNNRNCVIADKSNSNNSNNSNNSSNEDDDLLWATLLSYRESGFLMGASCGNDELKLGENEYKARGLQSSHAYALLHVHFLDIVISNTDGTEKKLQERMVKLRNPWGGSASIEWNGDWGRHSLKWTPAARDDVGYYADKHTASSGVFWMSFRDFLHFFSIVEVCKLRPDWSRIPIAIPFILTPKAHLQSDGVPLLRMEVFKPMTVCITFDQPKLARNSQLGLSNICMILLRDNNPEHVAQNSKTNNIDHSDVRGRFTFIAASWAHPCSTSLLEANVGVGYFVVAPLVLTRDAVCADKSRMIVCVNSPHPVVLRRYEHRDSCLVAAAAMCHFTLMRGVSCMSESHSSGLKIIALKCDGGIAHVVHWPKEEVQSTSKVGQFFRHLGSSLTESFRKTTSVTLNVSGRNIINSRILSSFLTRHDDVALTMIDEFVMGDTQLQSVTAEACDIGGWSSVYQIRYQNIPFGIYNNIHQPSIGARGSTFHSGFRM